MKVYLSRKADDFKFVSQIIKRRKLEPRLLGSSQEDRSEAAVRITERYPWGFVVFVTTLSTQTTAVVIGDDIMVEKLPWECLGLLAPPDHPQASTCYGSDNNEDERPCKWLDQCKVTTATCEALGMDPEQLLTKFKLDDIVSGKVLADHKASQEAQADDNEQPPDDSEVAQETTMAEDATEATTEDKPKTAKKPPAKTAKKPPAKTAKADKAEGAEGEATEDAPKTKAKPAKEPNGDKFAEVKPLASQLFGIISTNLDRPIADSKGDASIGHLYVVDKTPTGTGNSNYMTLYIKTPVGWDKALCSVRLIPRDKSLNIQIPATMEQITGTKGCKTLLQGFEAKDWNDGQLKSVIQKISEDKLDDAAKVVSTVGEKVVELPPVVTE